jgi:hypothetical protein
MGGSLASFRDLKGIGPATEARLYETGIYTWEALAVVATALAAVRDEGETLRHVANAVAARRAEAEDQGAAPRLPHGGERLESFVLRMALTADGAPQRSEVTHVRTMAERAWAGWSPDELAKFIQKHSGVRPVASSHRESKRDGQAAPRSRHRPDTALRPPSSDTALRPPSSDHVVVLDAGNVIGGASRDINLVITNTRAAGGDFAYQATLAARRLGTGTNGGGWTPVASHAGTGSGTDEVVLEFPAVQLPPGVHRLQLRLEVKLPAPASRPPELALA